VIEKDGENNSPFCGGRWISWVAGCQLTNTKGYLGIIFSAMIH